MTDPQPTVSRRTVVVVRTGVANLASVVAAFERLGADVHLSEDADEVVAASHVMLPGVGAFGAGMAALETQPAVTERQSGPRLSLAEALKTRIQADRPTMAICLGMQLLGLTSEESVGVQGLGLVASSVTRFSAERATTACAATLKVPQLGWNRVTVPSDAPPSLVVPGYAYFANSYKFDAVPSGWTVSHADHGGPFVAAIERGRLLACQFHPELSGAWGLALLGRWLRLESQVATGAEGGR